MAAKAALKPRYKSKLEERVAKQLEGAGVSFGYETKQLKFTIPERVAKYTPDFVVKPPIIIEAKGRFGHKGAGGAAVRQRLILAKQQNPDLDIRIVFENASLPINKGSPTTYAKWAEDHEFKWADKGVVPAAWIKEMK
jgi:hypothetical protein